MEVLQAPSCVLIAGGIHYANECRKSIHKMRQHILPPWFDVVAGGKGFCWNVTLAGAIRHTYPAEIKSRTL